MVAEEVGREASVEVTCVCPFCEEVADASAPWCATCQVEVRFCLVCKEPLPQDASECPSCGAECEG